MDSVLLYETKLIIFVFPQRQFLLFTQTISCTVGDCSSSGCCVMDSIVPGQVGQGTVPCPMSHTLSHKLVPVLYVEITRKDSYII